MTLNIAYVTSRKEPCFEWFADSLKNQIKPEDNIRVIIVDFFASERTIRSSLDVSPHVLSLGEWHVAPKPTPWQGPHRLTKHDYFAPSNARNTALCYALDGWIVYVDDLSVLMPGWLAAVREAIAENRITCGAFRKVNKLVVEKGNVVSYEDHPAGVDSRWNQVPDDKPSKCPPNWLFGCSVVMPVEALLKINGWPELCDSTGIGMEDCHTGIALANNGYQLWYDRRMLTFESEERHHNQPTMLRMDKRGKAQVPIGSHPDEKGFAVVTALEKAKRFHNYFEPGGIAALRKKILAGEPFPMVVLPDTDFYDKQHLSEL
jgi:glycosyltransferase involved in cell wall biosynthesis